MAIKLAGAPEQNVELSVVSTVGETCWERWSSSPTSTKTLYEYFACPPNESVLKHRAEHRALDTRVETPATTLSRVPSGVLRSDNTEPQGKLEEADQIYLKLLLIQEEALGPDHPSLAETLNKRARFLQLQVHCLKRAIPSSVVGRRWARRTVLFCGRRRIGGCLIPSAQDQG